MKPRKPVTKLELDIRKWAAELAKNICDNDLCYDQWARQTPKMIRIYITEFLTEKLVTDKADA